MHSLIKQEYVFPSPALIDELPKELMLYIFKMLDMRTRLVCSQVSHVCDMLTFLLIYIA